MNSYTIEVYDKDGEILKTTISFKDDGSFTIKVNEAYTGNILIRLKDTGTGVDYLDEGETQGQNKDLSVYLRAIASSNGSNMTINLNMLTEIATRQLFQDSSNVDTDLSDFTSAQIITANENIATAFGLNGDIITTKPALVNTKKDDKFTNVDATEDEQALGYVLAAISGMETRDKNGDLTIANRKSTGTVLSELVNGITNGKLSQNVANDLVAGAKKSDEQDENADVASSFISSFESQIGNIDISDDTAYGDTDEDYITRTTSQDITATLTQALDSEKLWGGIDGGENWIDITTSSVTALAISWTIDLKEGENAIQFAITDNAATSPTPDNNNLASGKTANDGTPSIRISLKNSDNDIIAEKGDRIQLMKDDGTGYTHSKYVQLSEADIEEGWKDVTLSTLTTGDNKANKDYGFKVRIIDQVGNQGVLSDTYLITFDGNVEGLTLTSKEDTGVNSADGITSNETIIIGNIEKGAKVEYILDIDRWKVLESSAVVYDSDDKGTTTTLNIDANGSDSSGSGGTFASDISITLQNTGSTAITLSDLQADNLIVL
ncbi:hypothetical protein CVFO_0983 [Isorropodon fossajaponicum endosymbiont JTNG4]|uniref:hypothetical protein n=1 Tax=Isorropodon fossajaponicum symbiont TaxID=883811 RepID=UPI0019150E2C|nr:hypothetical protein [Isorropodon fossajaponicum symbiont]BBB24134.1 hypothetical protein CVFO_0983 [Isorropodon fossajaponicum endosymbiont JTNG4]